MRFHLAALATVLLCACHEFAVCGDGVVNGDETCDDADSDDGDECPSTCQLAVCGDGFVQIGVEECDNGPANSDTAPDACRTDCRLARCGDGVRDSTEGCDDGNNSDDDACLTTCVSARCGDGIIQPDVEQCDDGAANNDKAPDACRKNCTGPRCGDGVVDVAHGETCDDRNTTDTDFCRNTCVLATCGDGVVWYVIEQCDNGPANSDTAADACRTNCTLPRCGDGARDTAEACDDGNTSQNDYCLAGCIANTCGDGIVNYYAESCEDRNTFNDDDCIACRVARCGDGALHEGVEQCDDGTANSNTTPNACRTSCTRSRCGDGVVDAGEICDDGLASTSCDVDCTAPECRDGLTNVAAGETCDDGNAVDGDGCSSVCGIESGWIVYVNAGATGNNNGTSWPDAYTSLHDALINTTRGEIWVAVGTYVPDVGVGVTPDDPFATFPLRSNVSVYGGFVGNEVARVQRGTGATILDGHVTSTISAHHVVTATGATGARLDGFTIQNGLDSDTDGGAGLLLRSSSLVIENCLFVYNTRRLDNATQDANGGAIYADTSDLTIVNSNIYSNSAIIASASVAGVRAQGGAIYVRGGRLTVRNSEIRGEAVVDGEARGGAFYLEGATLSAVSTAFYLSSVRGATTAGGAIFLDSSATATIYNSTFGNDGTYPTFATTGQECSGGAIYASGGSQLIVANTLFNNDSTTCSASYGGAIYVGASTARVDIRNCTFAANSTDGVTAVQYGGAIYVASGGSAVVHNAVFWDNRATNGPDVFAEPLAAAIVTYSCTQTSGWGTGTQTLTASPFSTARYALVANSVCIDAGDSGSVPADLFDLDRDGNLSEPVPRDLFGSARFMDDPDRPDTGTGSYPIVDMGCYEHH